MRPRERRERHGLRSHPPRGSHPSRGSHTPHARHERAHRHRRRPVTRARGRLRGGQARVHLLHGGHERYVHACAVPWERAVRLRALHDVRGQRRVGRETGEAFQVQAVLLQVARHVFPRHALHVHELQDGLRNRVFDAQVVHGVHEPHVQLGRPHQPRFLGRAGIRNARGLVVVGAVPRRAARRRRRLPIASISRLRHGSLSFRVSFVGAVSFRVSFVGAVSFRVSSRRRGLLRVRRRVSVSSRLRVESLALVAAFERRRGRRRDALARALLLLRGHALVIARLPRGIGHPRARAGLVYVRERLEAGPRASSRLPRARTRPARRSRAVPQPPGNHALARVGTRKTNARNRRRARSRRARRAADERACRTVRS
mmetsp:Transcript_14249/g.61018  ORF Transcript_14249/g.61018 Transcript_14249/m.61018 type:complete len:372 (+) Transcript_14249:2152-3267(+)